MIGEEGEGQSYPMQERDVRNPVVTNDTFEKRMERRQKRKFKPGKRK